MMRECPACPGHSWNVPEQVDAWWSHVRSAEHEAARHTPEGRANIARFWAERDAKDATQRILDSGMLF